MKRLGMLVLMSLFSSQLLAGYLFVEGKFDPAKKWVEFSQDEKLNLKNLLQKLAQSKSGKKLIKMAKRKAKESGNELSHIISSGRGSLTDTTLVRRFSVGKPNDVVYEEKSKVFLNKELTQYDALLDLAHELTHYVYRENFNPYIKNFTLSEFIAKTIEGKGGEVQAFLMECQVHYELFNNYNYGRYQCSKIIDPTSGKLSFDLAVKQFYKVGRYFESFQQILGQHGIKGKFPDVSSDKASFVSSAYGIPYPVAAFEEYLSVVSKVCENDKRRLRFFKKAPQRSLASISDFEEKYKKRCKDFL